MEVLDLNGTSGLLSMLDMNLQFVHDNFIQPTSFVGNDFPFFLCDTSNHGSLLMTISGM